MEKPKLSKEQEYKIYRGFLYQIQFDTYRSKYLLSKNKINEAVSNLNDVKNLLEKASRLDYFPENMIRFLSARYNAVVLNPKIQKHPKKPCGFGIKEDQVESPFTKEELDLIGDGLEGFFVKQDLGIEKVVKDKGLKLLIKSSA